MRNDGPEIEDIQADAPATEDLHDRIRRLEDALAAIADTKVMEQRVVARLMDQMGDHAAAAGAPPESATPANGEPPPSRILSQLSLALPALSLPPSAAALAHSALSPSAQQPWLIVEIWRELRLMVAMFADFRFRASWLARMSPLFLVGGMVLAWFFLSGLPVVGAFVERFADVVLAVVTYKILAREAARYRKEVAQKPYYRA